MKRFLRSIPWNRAEYLCAAALLVLGMLAAKDMDIVGLLRVLLLTFLFLSLGGIVRLFRAGHSGIALGSFVVATFGYAADAFSNGIQVNAALLIGSMSAGFMLSGAVSWAWLCFMPSHQDETPAPVSAMLAE